MATKKKSPRNNVVAVRTLKKWQHHLVLVSLVLSLSKACMCAQSRVYSGDLYSMLCHPCTQLWTVSRLSDLRRLTQHKKVIVCSSLSPQMFKIVSVALFHFSLLLFQCGDIETNPGPTNGIDSDVDVHSKICKRSFVLNCGFARVAVIELSTVEFGCKRDAIDKGKRLSQFLKLFKHCSILLFLKLNKPSKSFTYFDDYCDYILKVVGKGKWTTKQQYLDTFALKKWEKMSVADRKQHTISKCYACGVKFHELQQAFPAQPFFQPSIIDPGLLCGNAKSDGKSILKELNGLFVAKYNQSFTDILPQVCTFIVPRTQSESKQNRSCERALVRNCENLMSENIAVSHLAECESDASYLRKRAITSFCASNLPKPKKQYLGSIDAEKEADIVAYLKEYSDEKPVVWSTLARKFDIKATNDGYMIKQLAIKSGLNVKALQGKGEFGPRKRVHKKKASADVAVPCMPSLSKLKENINDLKYNGTLCLGEPCAPYPIYQYKWVEGKLEKVESRVWPKIDF